MTTPRIIVIGGGAAGFMAAITCAESNPRAIVTVLEKARNILAKVRISGGGRCNVTHACFDVGEFVTRYPRGSRELIGPFQRFQARDTVEWFENRGVKLKTEPDGRMFPVTDDSSTIVECLTRSAKAAGVQVLTRCNVERVEKGAEFSLQLTSGEVLRCDRLLLATGGSRSGSGSHLAEMLGHSLTPPVPSLFTFHIETPWLRQLPGLSVESVEASVPGTPLRERGAMLITHTGLSGPAILRLSAWGARLFHDQAYRFPLLINWLPEFEPGQLGNQRETQPAKLVVNTPLPPLPARLWEQLVLAAGISRETRWSRVTRLELHRVSQQLTRTELTVTGKSLNKEEFVTCGGVSLKEVNFKTMESRTCPGLHLAGETLDIDGLTGGFNFQAAWTTGWIAGRSLAG
jgi:hypothetical protein